ncbi:MAG: hypothetical protein AB1898_21650 [Acidobacteriota bacterium]
MKDHLSEVIPAELRAKAIFADREHVFPYPEVIDVIQIATQHGIAVLGVESFEVQPDGVKVDQMSDYEVLFTGEWEPFVELNNSYALDFVRRNPRCEDHGFILTATSRSEFDNLHRGT